MGRDSPIRVFALMHGEFRKDARVEKEVRHMAGMGWEITVFCNWAPGVDRVELIDGIQIKRYECFRFEDFHGFDLERLNFLEASRDFWISDILQLRELAKRCSEAEMRRSAREKDLERLLSESTSKPPLTRSYYREHSGIVRAARKARYLLATYIFAREKQNTRSRNNEVGNLKKEIRDLKLEAKSTRAEAVLLRQGIAQAKSLLVAANLSNLKIRERPDVIHCHDIYSLPAAVMLSNTLGGRVIFDAHEYELERVTAKGKYSQEMVDFLERDCLCHVSGLVTVSNGLAELYSIRFPHRKPVVVMNIPEFRDTTAKIGAPKAIVPSTRSQIGLSEHSPLIVYTGNVQGSNRGLDKVLLALARLPDYHLAVLGPRNEKNDHWLESIAADLELTDRIHLMPPVNWRDVTYAISDCDVAVCPIQDVSLSYRHSMPNKLFEAAFAGLPICVSDLPDMREFVEELGIGVVMDQTDPGSIAAALQKAFEHRSDYSLVPSARADFVKRYGWEAQASRLNELYTQILGKAPRVKPNSLMKST